MYEDSELIKLKDWDIFQGMQEESNIEDVIRRINCNGNNYYFYDTLNNTIDSYTLGLGDSDAEDIIIILQGPIKDIHFLQFTIRRYFMLYKSIRIIISTWVDKSHKEIESLREFKNVFPNLYLIENNSKEELSHLSDEKGTIRSVNLQIFSTKVAVKLAESLGCKYILKQRIDSIFGHHRFIDSLRVIHKTYREHLPPSQKGRIVVGSSGSYRYKAFTVPDHFSFGFIEDMKLMWDVPFRNTNKIDCPSTPLRSPSKLDRIPITNDIEIKYLYRLYEGHAPEPYILRNLFLKSGLTYSHDRFDSIRFLASSFVIYDSTALGYFWPKYGLTGPFSKHHSAFRTYNAIKNRPPISRFRWSEINFTDWLEYYSLISQSK